MSTTSPRFYTTATRSRLSPLEPQPELTPIRQGEPAKDPKAQLLRGSLRLRLSYHRFEVTDFGACRDQRVEFPQGRFADLPDVVVDGIRRFGFEGHDWEPDPMLENGSEVDGVEVHEAMSQSQADDRLSAIGSDRFGQEIGDLGVDLRPSLLVRAEVSGGPRQLQPHYVERVRGPVDPRLVPEQRYSDPSYLPDIFRKIRIGNDVDDGDGCHDRDDRSDSRSPRAPQRKHRKCGEQHGQGKREAVATVARGHQRSEAEDDDDQHADGIARED